jgi:hypothetical protein
VESVEGGVHPPSDGQRWGFGRESRRWLSASARSPGKARRPSLDPATGDRRDRARSRSPGASAGTAGARGERTSSTRSSRRAGASPSPRARWKRERTEQTEPREQRAAGRTRRAREMTTRSSQRW